MRIYCLIAGNPGPSVAQNQAALETLYDNWQAKIAEQEDNVSCVLQINNHSTSINDFKQAVKEAYNADFQYNVYVSADDKGNQENMPQETLTKASSDHSTPLVIPADSPFNIEGTKYYVFNTTGNIMMVSTNEGGQMAESVRGVFEEVSVFFAAMTKAITNTPNPNNKNKPYSLYNYAALEKVIGGSGLFIHITEEDISYETTNYGAKFGRELIEGLLGLAIGEGALTFADAMMSSMGSSALKIKAETGSEHKRVANIIFICEYLLGMPAISAIVTYVDLTDTTTTIDIGPCYQTSEHHSSWKLHKDTYMFVTPKFIKEYSGDLDSAAGNLQFNIFVDYLKALVTGAADIVGVTTADGQKAPTQLESTKTYYIVGANFGDTNPGGTPLSYGSTGTTISVAGWSDNIIGFTVSGTAVTTAKPVTVEINGTTYSTAGFTFVGDTNTPKVTGAYTKASGGDNAPTPLLKDVTYYLQGVNLGTTSSNIKFGDANIQAVSNEWKDSSIGFKVSGASYVTNPTVIQAQVGGTYYSTGRNKYTYTKPQ